MQPVRQRWTQTAALAGTLVVAVLWILFSAAWLLFVWWYGLPWYLSVPAVILLPMCLALLVVRVWTLAVRPLMVGRYFGRAMAELSPTQTRPGGTVAVRYERPVRAEVDVHRVATQLILRETVRYYRHDARLTRTQDQIVAEHERSGRRYLPGEIVGDEARFTIPSDGAASVATKDRALTWLVRLRIVTPATPDVLDELPFTVVPAQAVMTRAATAV
jgi:hypothetical protein